MNLHSEEISWPQKRKIIKTIDEKIEIDSTQSQLDKSVPNDCLSGVVATDSYELTGAVYSGIKLSDDVEPVLLGSGIVKGVLGEGGMARVYRIWNEKLEIFRAVKLYQLAGRPELIKRFEMEMKISANLCHPNIIQIHSTGEWNGRPFIEMELVEGVSLEKSINQYSKFPAGVVLSIGCQISDALCYAHNKQMQLYGKTYQGIIHRDLKPANIMLSESGVVKLLDFGIARPAEVRLNTIAGNIVGTLPYLSPEQIDGDEIDQRSDIYSLGTILYEMLKGEKTFPQTTVMDLLKMKYTGKYRKFDNDSGKIPLKLSRIVEKCLEVKKENRFNSSSELKEELFVYVNKSEKGSHPVIPKSLISLCSKLNLKSHLCFDHLLSEQQRVSRAQHERLFGLISKIPFDLKLLNKFAKRRFNQKPKYKKEYNNAKLSARKLIGKKLSFNSFCGVFGTISIVFLFFQFFNDNNTINPDKLTISVSSVDSFDVKSDINVNRFTIPQQSEEIKSNETKNGTSLHLVNKKPIKKTEINAEKLTLIQIKKLRDAYRKDDLYAIADTACKISRFRDAIIALENIAKNHSCYNNGMILLTYAYLEDGNLEKAEKIANNINSLDAFFCIIIGRIELNRKNELQALEIFQLALTRSSFIRPNNYVRNESVYYTALIYDNWFIADPGPENRHHAKIAWNNLKRLYTPDHVRFKLAERKLSGL